MGELLNLCRSDQPFIVPFNGQQAPLQCVLGTEGNASQAVERSSWQCPAVAVLVSLDSYD